MRFDMSSYRFSLLSAISHSACWCPRNMGHCAWIWNWTKSRIASLRILWHLGKRKKLEFLKKKKFDSYKPSTFIFKIILVCTLHAFLFFLVCYFKLGFLRKWGLYNQLSDFPVVKYAKFLWSEKFHWNQWLCEELFGTLSEGPRKGTH